MRLAIFTLALALAAPGGAEAAPEAPPPPPDEEPWSLDLTRDVRRNAVLLPPAGCTCVEGDDRDGRGVVIP